MKDVMQRNPGTISGTPTLIPSMLLRDTNQALRFSGGSSFTIPHSDNLTLLDGAVGGVAFTFPLNIPAYPASEKYLFNKSGEFAASILSDGTLRFYLTGGHVDSSAPIPVGTDKFVTLVYNGGYTGDPVAGNNDSSPDTMTSLLGDYRAGALTGALNLQVSPATILERGLVTAVHMLLQRERDTPSFQDVAALIYADSSGAPGAKLAQSAGQLLGDTVAGTRPVVDVTFPVTPFIMDEGDDFHVGYAGGALHTSDFTVMTIGSNNSGGSVSARNFAVSAGGAGPASNDCPDPFARTTTGTNRLCAWVEYTPLARTGDEGHLLIYLDGQEDSRAAYADGITPGTADMTGPEFDVKMDDLVLWDRRLGPVEIAQIYAAR